MGLCCSQGGFLRKRQICLGGRFKNCFSLWTSAVWSLREQLIQSQKVSRLRSRLGLQVGAVCTSVPAHHTSSVKALHSQQTSCPTTCPPFLAAVLIWGGNGTRNLAPQASVHITLHRGVVASGLSSLSPAARGLTAPPSLALPCSDCWLWKAASRKSLVPPGLPSFAPSFTCSAGSWWSCGWSCMERSTKTGTEGSLEPTASEELISSVQQPERN